jgi:arsenate reductase-like glutaredoxin family protein
MANELKTYGDLKAVIQTIIKGQRKEKVGGVGIDAIIGQIPVISNIKTGIDLVRAFVEAPDTKKTKTWLDKLQIDDNMSKIIDNAVENGFIEYVGKEIEDQQDSKPLEQDFNMNQKLVDFLKNNYQGRTITGIKENNMKKELLKKIIKEEILKIIEAETASATPTVNSSTTTLQQKQSPEVKKLIDYLNNAGKPALGNINNRVELNQVLTAIWNGMNKTMQKDSNAKSVYNIISQKIK